MGKQQDRACHRGEGAAARPSQGAYDVMGLKGPLPCLSTPCTTKHSGVWAGSEVTACSSVDESVPGATALRRAGSRVGDDTEQFNTLTVNDWTNGYPG